MTKRDSIKEYEYSSVLAPWISRFVSEKRSFGYKYNLEARMLARFDRFLIACSYDSVSLDREIFERYTKKTSYENSRNHITRYMLIKQFATYLHRLEINAYISTVKIQRQSDFIPYIFSDQEIAAIMHVLDNYDFSSACPQRHKILPMLFRILYGCGMRIAETLNLLVKDVDLAEGVFYVREGKFNKERLVPMSKSLKIYTEKYMSDMSFHSLDAPFLPSSRNAPYGSGTINALFHRILFQAGIPYGGRGNGPRLHDLRHTFAVHCMKCWVKNGVDVTASLPYLSIYLGHKNLHSTQKYLRLTADMFPDITKRVENEFGNLIPYGTGGNNEIY